MGVLSHHYSSLHCLVKACCSSEWGLTTTSSRFFGMCWVAIETQEKDPIVSSCCVGFIAHGRGKRLIWSISFAIDAAQTFLCHCFLNFWICAYLASLLFIISRSKVTSPIVDHYEDDKVELLLTYNSKYRLFLISSRRLPLSPDCTGFPLCLSVLYTTLPLVGKLVGIPLARKIPGWTLRPGTCIGGKRVIFYYSRIASILIDARILPLT